MRVATWNINNVIKRLDLLLGWLERAQPDVVALQELKTPTAAFPTRALADAGYQSLVVGQRTWNGVALLARGQEPLPVVTSLPGDAKDKEARYVEAAINGVLFACLYLPNGNPQPGPKFDYKLRWFERMRQRADVLWSSGQPVVLMGDWNVVPTDADIYKPDTWRDNALLQPEPREAYAAILSQGWTDALRAVNPKKKFFTFWDYRRKRWERDAGLRIDHILVSASLQVVDAGVDREERGQEGASDHAPVWAEVRAAAAKRARRFTAKPVRPQVNEPPSRAAGKPKAPAAEASASQPLARYNAKRDFTKTAEPTGALPPSTAKRDQGLVFVIQKHWASRLHYDVRLELDGVMVSWAVPKGPSFDPARKQMAIHVEDHPIDYNTFEGAIPKGEYGGGKVIVWDQGTWEPVGDPREALAKGKLMLHFHGQKLAGLWEFVRISKPGAKKQDQWIFFKKRGDAWARPSTEYDVIAALPDSVVAQPLGLAEEREPHRVRAAPPVATAADLQQARKAPLPAKLVPQLATLVSSVPSGKWVVESKFDGYRLLARINGSEVRLFTRNGHDWTDKLAPIAQAIAEFGLESAWLDGEIVVLNDAGLPDFNRLQNAIDNARTRDIEMFVFDAPYLGGMDLREVPLASRRAALKQLFEERGEGIVRFSQSFDVMPGQLLDAACQMGMEGVMVKRADAPYTAGRSEAWLKLKCQHRQEFVVVGFTERAGASKEVGSLLLGYHEGPELRFAGSVGTGWGSATARELKAMLTKLLVKQPAVAPEDAKPGRWSKRAAGSERWVQPTVVVEVAFSEWTPDRRVRHAVFRGVRTDKPAALIVRERAKAMGSGVPAKTAPKTPGLKVTNPERVIDASTGLRKVDLVRYYESVAEWMLPHPKGRPTSLVRGPTGVTGELFFQKHDDKLSIPHVRNLPADLWPGHAELLEVPNAQALVACAQMNVIEFHTWNSLAKNIDRPDRIVFDLDPGEGAPWQHVQEAAVLVRSMLEQLGLECWLKTSGGKGLHVVVPLAPRLDYDTVKDFSQSVVQHLARTIPSRFVAKSGPKNRVGKLFVDYLRNGHGATTATAFSARSRPGLGVSMPIAWEQLGELKSGAQWTIATAREYLSFQQADPWSGYWKKRQSLTAAMRLLAGATS
ncbi:DNA ligase D [Pseudorhodoferax soli]|uniref:DNA ligase (ATP) n=1 Tax=Pseudorhodoferax soli TaxID=545864 RepID=A0A368XTK6_9BURK|nr:DNA ligase D [Pseudorhodoferax soli]RCW69354.1 ATP-dependent DNA ligase LigD phosphoesterase module /ATP-dependent DNA ligase LigD polymerase module [Pseudorhodoferax soli]